MGDFSYSPLDNPQWDIRLLEFQSGIHEGSSDLCFTFRRYARVNTPKYAALSYTWGQEPATEQILLNGLPFPIRPNLSACLRQLYCSEREHDFLWVDAICIDQSSTAERSAQVACMAEIYVNADLVLAWLGVSKCTQPSYGPSGSGLRRQLSLLRYPELLRQLQMLPYWSRTWIVQELRLARRVQFLWGASKFQWGDFAIAMRLYMLPRGIWDRFCWIFKPGSAYNNLPDPSFLGVPGFESQAARRHLQGAPLASYMRLHFRFKCADPRDRIFAMLGLVSEEELAFLANFFPDYSMSYEKVVLIVVAYLKYHPSFFADYDFLRGLGWEWHEWKTQLKNVERYESEAFQWTWTKRLRMACVPVLVDHDGRTAKKWKQEFGEIERLRLETVRAIADDGDM